MKITNEKVQKFNTFHFYCGSVRFLSVRGNLLRRITLEELKAMPKLSALDLSHNPLDCDEDFNMAVQWLTDHGITPTEIRT